MKKPIVLLFIISLMFLSACNDEKTEQPVADGVHQVVVKSTQNASSYTYMLVEENDEEYWIAVPQMDIKPGEKLVYSKSMEMLNFKSPSINKTFDRILFIEEAAKHSDGQIIPAPHSQVKSAGKQQIKVSPAPGGVTIEKIHAGKEDLNGKRVIVRGVVTRFNEGIMDMNWIHLQDGTGTSDDFDLTITTLDRTSVGKEITVEGTVVLNRDFGAGYSYAVMLEDASIKSE